jgi:hypothetical protein
MVWIWRGCGLHARRDQVQWFTGYRFRFEVVKMREPFFLLPIDPTNVSDDLAGL